ncbi:MAG: cysteine--tRNA ligase [Canibacter sp.]
MTQRIYDSKQQTLIDFVPITPGEVSMYVCGPTVQSAPHIGHLRSALVYDQMRRWLTTSGHRVTLIRNVTDIDDKILANATQTEVWWALAARVERDFDEAYTAIGVAPPTASPRATGHIGDMVQLIDVLIKRGHAYVNESGSVYFATASWPEYGALTHQATADMEDSGENPDGKRDPQDFALWKAHRTTEPESASWPSPWGPGRPGWHIECSAMATRFLGNEFDIHGGGLDLRFPHHENELAQSNAAGHPFARVWVHNGLVNTGGQKMSKSLGNSLFAAELLRQAEPLVIRYFLGSAHYRSVLEFTPSSLTEAAAALQRVEAALVRAKRELGEIPEPHEPELTELPAEFIAELEDDFAIPGALAVVHSTTRRVNSALDTEKTEEAARDVQALVAMLGVLHIDPRHPDWVQGSAASPALDLLVGELISRRAEARKARDFATSDAIRDQLQAAGITLEDTAGETHWSVTNGE